MRIEPVVSQIAQCYGVDAALIQAVIQAEGGGDAILKAVRCSIPNIVDREAAIRVTCRSALHALYDFYFKAGGGTQAQFVEYFGARWAPKGAANDPTALNKNWPVNVTALWIGK